VTTVISASETMDRHEDVDWMISCKECHLEDTPEVVNEWEAGMHGVANVGCFVCHGDGEDEFYPEPTSDACISCHDEVATGQAAASVSSCFTCHSGHSLKFHGG